MTAFAEDLHAEWLPFNMQAFLHEQSPSCWGVGLSFYHGRVVHGMLKSKRPPLACTSVIAQIWCIM